MDIFEKIIQKDVPIAIAFNSLLIHYKIQEIFIIKNTHYIDIFNSYKIHDILDIITENFLCLKVLKLDNFGYIVGKNIYIEDLSKNKINIFDTNILNYPIFYNSSNPIIDGIKYKFYINNILFKSFCINHKDNDKFKSNLSNILKSYTSIEPIANKYGITYSKNQWILKEHIISVLETESIINANICKYITVILYKYKFLELYNKVSDSNDKINKYKFLLKIVMGYCNTMNQIDNIGEFDKFLAQQIID